MSSLTDIIFLLLIFFMLTSTLIRIQVNLPESESKTVAATSVVVTINQNGEHVVGSKPIPRAALERELTNAIRENKGELDDFTITIAAEVGTPFDYVVDVMQIASRQRVKAIIATQPPKQ